MTTKKGFSSFNSGDSRRRLSVEELEKALRIEPLPDHVTREAIIIARVISECFYKYQSYMHTGITEVPNMSEFISYFAEPDDAPFAENLMASYALRDPYVLLRMSRWRANFIRKPKQGKV